MIKILSQWFTRRKYVLYWGRECLTWEWMQIRSSSHTANSDYQFFNLLKRGKSGEWTLIYHIHLLHSHPHLFQLVAKLWLNISFWTSLRVCGVWTYRNWSINGPDLKFLKLTFSMRYSSIKLICRHETCFEIHAWKGHYKHIQREKAKKDILIKSFLLKRN